MVKTKYFSIITALLTFCLSTGCITRQVVVKPDSSNVNNKPDRISTEHKQNHYNNSSTYQVNTEIEKGKTLLINDRYREAIDYFQSLRIRYPANSKVQYNLSIAYDEFGNRKNALVEYETFIEMTKNQYKSEILRNKTNERINQIRDELANDLLKKAKRLSEVKKYDEAVEILEEAFWLRPSDKYLSKIRRNHTSCTYELIADEMLTCCRKLNLREVALSNFVDLHTKDDESNTNEIVAELKGKLQKKVKDLGVNFQERQFFKHIINELTTEEEFGSESLMVLEKIADKSVEALIVGSFDFLENDNVYKLHVRMVSTGLNSNFLVGSQLAVKSGRLLNLRQTFKIMSESSAYNVSGEKDEKDIKVWTDHKQYHLGEWLKIHYRPKYDCYVYLFGLMSDNTYILLFPNRYEEDNFVNGGATYTIPSFYSSNEYIRIQEPVGKDSILAIATSRKILEKEMKSVIKENYPDITHQVRGFNDNKNERGLRSVSPIDMDAMLNLFGREDSTRGFEITQGPANKLQYDLDMWSIRTVK